MLIHVKERITTQSFSLCYFHQFVLFSLSLSFFLFADLSKETGTCILCHRET